MREIIVAPHSGFCFGVENAIKTAEKAARSDRTCHTCGMIIHNNRVTADLAEKGVTVISELTQAEEGAAVIVRSHGEPKAFYDDAERMGIDLIDATCPFVARIHDIAAKAYSEGRQVFIVGDKTHPEVKGTNGWCENTAIVLKDADETKAFLDKLTEDEKSRLRGAGKSHAGAEDEGGEKKSSIIVAQTTIRREVFEDVLELLTKEGIDLEVNNTICNATRDRQQGCVETAKKVDAMIVIGDKKSSNTGKLYEIAKKNCENVFFAENLADLPLKELEKYNRIGLAAGASTPDYAIKEVIASMSEKFTEDSLTMEDLMEDIDKSLRLPRGGEMVVGTVFMVTDDYVIVNLGCKKDGMIPLDEISLEEGQTLKDAFKEGDEIQAKVIKTDNGDGYIMLSRKKLEASEHWDEINKAYEEKELIDVEVERKVNGGVIARYKEVSGFIPLSQLSDRYVEDSSEFIGQTLTVKVSRVDPRRGKAVFSHKAYLNEERQKALEKVWANINVDDIVEGTVMRFTEYGAFVDIGGIDGLLHISEISWGKLKHPKEVLSIGDKISVKILSMNEEKGKISLGLKQTIPEPWSVIDENYSVGQVVKGKVVQIKEYGCFVELEPGLDGLVHISEIKNERVADINDELSVGDEVNAKILEIDKERKRISLSIKETLDMEAPAEEAAAEAEEAPAEEAPVTEEAEEAVAPAEEAPAEDAE